MVIIEQCNQIARTCRNPGNSYSCRAVDIGLSVKLGLGHWQTVQTQIRSRNTTRLIRVCTVCLNYMKLRVK